MARVHALTRRGHEYADKELSYGDITLRAETGELISENSIRLSQKEVDMLDTFLRNPEKELDCDYFLTHTWSDDRDASSDMVYLYVKYLRDKLDYINSTVTIRGDKGGPYQLMEM